MDSVIFVYMLCRNKSTFGEGPKLLWRKDTGCKDNIIADNAIIRIVSDSFSFIINTIQIVVFSIPRSILGEYWNMGWSRT